MGVRPVLCCVTQHSTGRAPIVKYSQQIHNKTCCHSTLLIQRIESVTVLNVTSEESVAT